MNDVKKKVNDYVYSLIRTYVPVVVGLVLGWLARKYDIVIDGGTSTAWVLATSAILIALYNGVVRALESFIVPKLGAISWFLGDFRKGNTAPVYPDATETIVLNPAQVDPEIR